MTERHPGFDRLPAIHPNLYEALGMKRSSPFAASA